ncbi:hypothetical protein [Vibrio sp. 10N]|uniref:hypothetical protein n=1 Tax=Vibrio sp. 10N TaxID=3058938 RepID=UPI002812A663|nr:hypothetical protein VB10N_06410 [Vibrio sp. 10N]
MKNLHRTHCLAVALAPLAVFSHTISASEIFTTHDDGTALGIVDANSGQGANIGPFGSNQTWAAAFDPNDTLYTITNGFSGAGATLAIVDENTATITPVGSVGTNMISLEVTCEGVMYGVGYNDRVLYEIDQNTGNTTAIGNTAIASTMDLALDSNGALWATVGNRLWTLDTNTGASTPMTTITGVASGSVMGIMFDSNDNLYATAYVSDSPLYLIDVGTGAATPVGNTGFTRPHGGDFRPDCIIAVDIDIKPDSNVNPVNHKSKGKIPVAVLTTDTFDAAAVDPTTVTFGPDGATPAHGGHMEDVDLDGDLDLILHFKTQDTGIQCGDTQAILNGKTYEDRTIEGVDLIHTVACKDYMAEDE